MHSCSVCVTHPSHPLWWLTGLLSNRENLLRPPLRQQYCFAKGFFFSSDSEKLFQIRFFEVSFDVFSHGSTENHIHVLRHPRIFDPCTHHKTLSPAFLLSIDVKPYGDPMASRPFSLSSDSSFVLCYKSSKHQAYITPGAFESLSEPIY